MKKKILISSPGLELKNKRGTGFYALMCLDALNRLPHSVDFLSSARSVKLINNKIEKGEVNDVLFKYRLKHLFYFLLSCIYCYPIKNQVRNKANQLLAIKKFVLAPLIHDISYLLLKFMSRSSIIKTQNYDVFFSTEPTGIKVSRRTKVIQTLHDTIPLEEEPMTPYGKVFRKTLVKMIKHSDIILSVSEYSKKRLLHHFPTIDSKKVVVTHQPIPFLEGDYNISGNSINDTLQQLSLKSKDYFFYVGAIEDRKNINELISIFQELPSSITSPLVLAGEINPESFELVKTMERVQNKEFKNVKYLGYLSNDQKKILLKECLSFVFLSHSEGFGIPPLEAMKMNAPVLCSNKTSLPEVCGDAAILVNPDVRGDVKAALIRLYKDEKLRKNLVVKGQHNIKRFTKEEFVKKMESAINSLYH